jgi:agmatine deiminase
MTAIKSNQVIKQQIPAKLGFRMPAEWAPHEATWLVWPQNAITWPGKHMKIVEEIYLQMMEALLPGEKVHLLVNDAQTQEKVASLLKKRGVNLKNFLSHQVPTIDAWIRDYGPTFITRHCERSEAISDRDRHVASAPRDDNRKAWIKWRFNAWGSKYDDLAQDTHVFEKSADLIPHPCFKGDFILEGGSIEVNGEGSLLTTEQCLLNKNRNPHLTRAQIEETLKNYLGIDQILWLGDGIEGDDTDGHIDDITRFVSKDTIVSCFEEDVQDKNYGPLKRNWELLEKSRDARGKKWNLVKLPMAGRVSDEAGRLPASYANFYIANGVVLLPVYSHKNDERAIAILKELFPTRRIIPIECTSLVLGFGSIHCVTQQEPEG